MSSKSRRGKLFGSKARKQRKDKRSRRNLRQLSLEGLEQRQLLAAFTWDSPVDSVWSAPTSWTITSGTDADGIPDADDDVIFDGTAATNSTIDPAFTVASGAIRSLNIDSTYGGQVGLGAETLSVSSGFTVDTATSFDAGTGTVRFTGGGTLNSAASLNNLEFATSSSITIPQTLNVSNDLTIAGVGNMGSGGNASRVINVGGDVIADDSNGWGQNGGQSFVTVTLVGTTDQHLRGSSGVITRLTNNNASADVLMDRDISVRNLGGVSGANLVNNGGQLRLSDSSSYRGTVDDVTLSGNSLKISQNLNVSNDLTIASVNTLGSGVNASKAINVSGDVIANDSNGWGNGSGSFITVTLVGTSTQHLRGSSGVITRLTNNNASADVLMDRDISVRNLGGVSSANLVNNGGQLRLSDSSSYRGTVDDVTLSGNSIQISQILNVSNDLTIASVGNLGSGGNASKSINVAGDVIANDSNGWGQSGGQSFVTVTLVGTSTQHLRGSSGVITRLTNNNASADVLMDRDISVRNLGGVSSANLVNNGGQLRLSDSSSYRGTVDDVTLSGNSIQISQILNVSNDLTIASVGNLGSGGNASKSINVAGDVIANDSNGWGQSGGQSFVTVTMVGTGDQSVLGSGNISRYHVTKPSGDVLAGSFSGSFSGGVVLTGSNLGDFDPQGSTVNASSYSVSGGFIIGTGTLNGNVTVNNGGGIAPGNSPGIITINGNLTLNSGSTLDVDINGDTPGTQHDQVVVNGAVSINGATIAGTTGAVPTGEITIIANDGGDGVSGSKFAGAPNDGDVVTIGGQDYAIFYTGDTGNDVVLGSPNAAPVINDQSFTIDENSADATVVGTAAASDPDLPADTLTWSITGGNTGGAFAIDSANGEITVASQAALDYETTPSFSLTVEVEDAAGETDTATVTIDLNDLQSTLSISDASVTEGGDLEFTVSLDSAVAYDSIVSYSTADGSATTADSDYTGQTAQSITIPAGQTSGTITVATTADNTVELDETMTITLTAVDAQGRDVTIGDGFATGTIVNDDSTVISISDTSAGEADGTIDYTLSISNPVDVPVSVEFDTLLSGSATPFADFTPESGVLVTFPAGSTAGQTVAVTIINDPIVENDETIDAEINTLDNGGRSVTIGDASATGTIIDDDTTEISINDVSIAEGDSGASTLTFTVSLSNPSALPVTVDYQTQDQSATDADDYDAASGTLTFLPLDTEESIDVTINGDNAAESDETFVVQLSNNLPLLVTSIGNGTGEGTILNDDFVPVADAGGPYTIDEGDGLTLDASGSTDADDGLAGLTFQWDVDGDGDFDENVTGVSPTITAATMAALGLTDGPDARTITVEASDGTNTDTATTSLTINNVDPDFEAGPDETLLPPVVGAFSRTGIDIDDPGSPETFSGTVNFGEPGGSNEPLVINQTTREFDLSHTYTNQGTFTVTVTVDDGDSGSHVDTFDVTVVLNSRPEIDDQSFDLDENSNNTTVVGTADADDPDLPDDTLTWSITGGNASGAFAIDSANGEITVANKSALDFETTPVFTLTVQVEDEYGDTDDATVTITLNDLEATLSIDDVSVLEGDAGTTSLGFTISVAGDAVNVPFSVDYDSADGTANSADYTSATGVANFDGSAGQTSPVNVTVSGDTLVEPDETLSVLLSNLTGTNDVTVVSDNGEGTILNDDFLGGRVFDDLDNDGVFDSGDGDAGIAGVQMQLVDEGSNAVVDMAVTGVDGRYEFGSTLPTGSYKIVEAAVAGLLDGKETAGVNGGTVDNSQDSNEITGIDVSGNGSASAASDYLFAEIGGSDVYGSVWEDFNNDGEINFGETGINGVSLTLSGTDDRGNAVSVPTTTSVDGSYAFIDLRPGTYSIDETQPAGYDDGQESLGEVTDQGVPTAQGDSGFIDGNDRFAGIQLVPKSEGDTYNFGEHQEAGGQIGDGTTATIGFWHNKNGQALIKSLNGSANSTQLGDWLAQTFPNMYGPGSIYDAARGDDQDMDLTGKTNAEVADIFKYLHKRNKKTSVAGGPVKVNAQVMAVALAMYATSENLSGGDYAASYGFNTSADGIAYTTFNVLDVMTQQEADDMGLTPVMDASGNVTIIDILLTTNDKADEGLLYDTDDSGSISHFEMTLRKLANELYTAINEGSDI